MYISHIYCHLLSFVDIYCHLLNYLELSFRGHYKQAFIENKSTDFCHSERSEESKQLKYSAIFG